MAHWQPLKKDVLDSLADEILQNYSTGRIAVDGDSTSGYAAFADGLADALRGKGTTVTRADESEPHANSGPLDTDLQVVAGEQLQWPARAGQWRFTVWVEGFGDDSFATQTYLRQVNPRARASAIIDNRDPEHPRQQFGDSC